MLNSAMNVTNKGAAMANVLRRMFSRRRNVTNSLSGIRNRLKLMKEDGLGVEEMDAQDMSEFEADFMNVSETHKMHEKEVKVSKERLKQKIVARKYFEENEPRFLTFEEKKQIHTLHESNPEEWPVEKLSESFPALPETIKKILRSKWSPQSIEKIIRYDNMAVENWKKFRAGKLVVSPILHKHLMKFKDRKIIMTDRELLAKKFVQPKPKFKKPTKQLFSSIVQGYLNEQQDDTKVLSQKDDQTRISDISSSSNQHQNLLATSITTDDVVAKHSKQLVLNEKENLTLRLRSDSEENGVALYDVNNEKKQNNNVKQLLTFNQFMKAGLKDASMSPEESVTLLNAYKDYLYEEEQTKEVAATSNNVAITAERNSAVSEYEDCDSDVAANDNLTDTRIKVWKKKVDTQGDYLKPIKITKSLYKPGITYRISDCYYDDDGEFLYRIPGVRS
ncbi:PREDICTED: uncharacterized protein LOC106752080 [Dinoponera quadriceps]|uniref:Uncharacterized protein LOC106752080 n=1 Tax=Dinoponera quadriceps TaxID=609295 RepID=A0A6P3YD74_DINQU|nr:PREDICTED: uncharacterized protein LOC106752080 [Dinoponera quadriceps]